MDRLRAAFVAVLLVSLANGGAAIADFGTNLQTIDAAGFVEDRIVVDATDVALRDGRVAVTVRVRNPTRLDLELVSGHFRIHNGSEARLASGAGERIEDGPTAVPAGESLTATYEIRLSPGQESQVEDALERDAKVTMRLALRLRDTTFTVVETADATGTGGGG